MLGQWQASLEASDLALRHKPQSIDVLKVKAEALRGLGREEEANTVLDQVKALEAAPAVETAPQTPSEP
jgi:hypothetical protein